MNNIDINASTIVSTLVKRINVSKYTLEHWAGLNLLSGTSTASRSLIAKLLGDRDSESARVTGKDGGLLLRG